MTDRIQMLVPSSYSTRVEAALREAIRAKLIWVAIGPNNSHLHYAAGYWP